MLEENGGEVKRILLAVLVCAAFGCNKPSDYFYVHPDITNHTITQKVKDVTRSNVLDIFWLVGSMTEQEQNFTSGVSNFMNSFIAKGFDWKMGVINNNITDPPILGIPSGFDSTTANPVQTMVRAVRKAIFLDDGEMIFDPLVNYLGKNPGFVRANSTLAIIMTNDAHDGSSTTTTAAQMESFLKGLMGGDMSRVIVYSIFGATDLDCDPSTIDEDWNFHGTELEKLVTDTGGQVYSLCDDTFGAQLAKLGDNLYKHVSNASISLTSKPDPATIRVFYHGTELPGGPQASGGMWYYDLESNSVIFYDLNFAKNDTDEVVVQYADDTGTN